MMFGASKNFGGPANPRHFGNPRPIASWKFQKNQHIGCCLYRRIVWSFLFLLKGLFGDYVNYFSRVLI